mgnify:CR=1 FL=1
MKHTTAGTYHWSPCKPPVLIERQERNILAIDHHLLSMSRTTWRGWPLYCHFWTCPWRPSLYPTPTQGSLLSIQTTKHHPEHAPLIQVPHIPTHHCQKPSHTIRSTHHTRPSWLKNTLIPSTWNCFVLLCQLSCATLTPNRLYSPRSQHLLTFPQFPRFCKV